MSKNPLICLLFLTGAGLSNSDPLRAQSIEMHGVDIIDDQGFGQRLVAASFLAPVGWTTQAFAAWPDKTLFPCKPTPTLVFQAVSPEKTTGVQVFPGQTWLSSPNASFAEQLRIQQSSTHVLTHCEVRPVVTAVDYLKTLIARDKSTAVISAGPMPEAATLARLIGSPNRHGRVSIDTARVYLRGTPDGIPTEGYTETALITTTNHTPMGIINQVSVPIVVNKFAPMGQLKDTDKLLSAIANAVSVNRDWQRRVDEFQARLQRTEQNINPDATNTAHELARIQQRANDYAYNVIRRAQRNARRGIDSSTHAFALSMNDAQDYQDPATGMTVLVSNQYRHVYANGQGEYLYSDAPIDDPDAIHQGHWRPMQPRQ